jgi:toxin ParE1/3/4
MQCFFSPLAEIDLEEIGDFIARDNPARAVSFIQEIKEKCQKITEAPEAFPLRLDIMNGLRMVSFRSYLIFYTIGESIRVERILHGARDYPTLFDA